MVVQGKVKLNGVKCSNPNQLLSPGDLISIEPSAVPMLSEELAKKAKTQKVNDAVLGEAEATEEAATVAAAEGEASTAEVKEGGEASADSTTAAADAAEGAASSGTSAENASGDKSSTTTTASSKGKEKEKVLAPGVLPFTLPTTQPPSSSSPLYLEVSFTTCSTIYVRHPTIVPYKTSPTTTKLDDLPHRSSLPLPSGGRTLLDGMGTLYTQRTTYTCRCPTYQVGSQVGRNGFVSQRAKDENMKRSALRRGWGRTKAVEGWRKHLAAAQGAAAGKQKAGASRVVA